MIADIECKLWSRVCTQGTRYTSQLCDHSLCFLSSVAHQDENLSDHVNRDYHIEKEGILAAKVIKRRLGNTNALRRRRAILTDAEKEEARRKNTTARRRHRALLSLEDSAAVKDKDIASKCYQDHL